MGSRLTKGAEQGREADGGNRRSIRRAPQPPQLTAKAFGGGVGFHVGGFVLMVR